VREIALEIVRPDGSRLPALVNSGLRHDDAGRPRVIRTTVFDATDRRRYEQELLKARRREQEVALELQRGLLAGALREGEGIEIGVAYRPADKGLEVGGDWYDAFWLEPGESLGIAVGDVVGRGLGAAATMGQLRSALRALASTGFEPAALLEALSEFSRRHAVGQMATVAYAEIDVRLGSMRYACAGHPPPAIVAPADAARFASDGRSPPLDAHTSWTDRPEGVSQLPVGAMVVLYTDGLIERSDRPLRAGLDELLTRIDLLRDEAPDTVASSLAHQATGATGRPDDVCVLALRLGPRPSSSAPEP
jgi:serine phosphatase RsbU (regulator of sigma subunit)